MNKDEINVVILCGGRGTRFKEQTEFIPKPMANIGNRPILWHIMKIYDHYGLKHFILPVGYKGEMIKEYFYNYTPNMTDFTINLKTGELTPHKKIDEDWMIHILDTGIDTMTAKRIFLVKHLLLDKPYFMLTYGDGVANIDIEKLFDFHKRSGRLVTISGYKPYHRFGIVEHKDGKVTNFNEKPLMDDLINCGFMVFNKEALKYFDGTDLMLEKVLPKIASDHQVSIYEHDGFWTSMDTQREYEDLDNLWKSNPLWKVWRD
jgi:glucose-1-phosphate cytidylyltransferase